MTTTERLPAGEVELKLAARHAAAAGALPTRYVDDLFIAGEYRPAKSAERTELVDPATGDVWGAVPVADASDVDAAVAAAARALPEWSRRGPSERAELLLAMADAIERRAEPLSITSTLENGSPLSETALAAANAAGILRYFASLADWLAQPDFRGSPNDRTVVTSVHRDPIGVCALIAPWNFPINLVLIKLAPALLAGCTVVVKPAPSTPLSVRYIIDAATEAGIPAGVVNLVTGDATVGDRLVRHPLVDKVGFTGSTSVGRQVAAACGELLRPVTLELGGKSAAVVLPDVDLDVLGSALLRSCLRNTGQTCYNSSRIVATPERYDDVVELAAAAVSAAVVGDPFDSATVFGPVATAAQRDVVRGYVRSGIREGARVATGGDVAPVFERGSWVVPTVFADVDPGMRIAREEIFGPVLSILRAADVDEAVAIANATEYGLGGIVFGQDEDYAFQVARRVDTGNIGLNFFTSNPAAPLAGRHDSGIGVEYGVEGLSQYLTLQSVHRRLGIQEASM
ncbi:aldehyde dehydrogenase family protein [Arthrobacter sp. CDRTa11]|uniref:aldehyde dehydrogenase family protein n=1 Tax=Arthrobacter sp. CDRTa11 TaxID=2651199 RepID=UPI002265906E|nr:aldehyde dehydrogenase family protein [Arthrobacter sp. CDRTa11]UZX03110.1 aldehyde dehydrogenase family protein [Arthrobacter sp. CDRTa11]